MEPDHTLSLTLQSLNLKGMSDASYVEEHIIACTSSTERAFIKDQLEMFKSHVYGETPGYTNFPGDLSVSSSYYKHGSGFSDPVLLEFLRRGKGEGILCDSFHLNPKVVKEVITTVPKQMMLEFMVKNPGSELVADVGGSLDYDVEAGDLNFSVRSIDNNRGFDYLFNVSHKGMKNVFMQEIVQFRSEESAMMAKSAIFSIGGFRSHTDSNAMGVGLCHSSGWLSMVRGISDGQDAIVIKKKALVGSKLTLLNNLYV